MIKELVISIKLIAILLFIMFFIVTASIITILALYNTVSTDNGLLILLYDSSGWLLSKHLARAILEEYETISK